MINDRIRAREVRLIGADGDQIGIRPLAEALDTARAAGLDLVVVADQANPLVCRIMDYGKHRYEADQRAKESRRKSSNLTVKEMKYRPKIGVGDFDTKTRKVEEFLSEGHKVKVTIMFRGREMQHPQLGRRILDRVAEAVEEVAKVEFQPRQDGRNMVMVLAPEKKAQARRAQERKRRQAAAEAEASAAGTAEDNAAAAEASPADNAAADEADTADNATAVEVPPADAADDSEPAETAGTSHPESKE